MSRSCCAALALVLPLALFAADAAAHVTLEQREAVAGSYYKAVLRVPHGCDGAPTTAIRLRLPDGVTGAKPMPKPGWELTTTKGPLAEPFEDHGRLVTEDVREIAWSGGRLQDAHYDEFVVRVRLPNTPGEVLHFPVVQECEEGVHRWIEIPEPGRSADDYAEPAPALRLLPRP